MAHVSVIHFAVPYPSCLQQEESEKPLVSVNSEPVSMGLMVLLSVESTRAGNQRLSRYWADVLCPVVKECVQQRKQK